jgi:hypothetical protein
MGDRQPRRKTHTHPARKTGGGSGEVKKAAREEINTMSIIPYLQAASLHIGDLYFEIPIYGSTERFFRERAYCYELYHQLRIATDNQSDFVIHGEFDKSSHPDFINTVLKQSKPDFLFHIPGGNKSSNRAVIEVKRCSAEKVKIKKDINHLSAFLDYGYEEAILLVFGRDIEPAKAKLRRLRDNEKLDLSRIIFLWHAQPHTAVGRFSLDE